MTIALRAFFTFLLHSSLPGGNKAYAPATTSVRLVLRHRRQSELTLFLKVFFFYTLCL